MSDDAQLVCPGSAVDRHRFVDASNRDLVIAIVAYLVAYPYRTLAIGTLVYLAFIPLSWKRFRALEQQYATPPATTPAADQAASPPPQAERPTSYGDAPRVVEMRPSEPKR